MCVYSVCTPGRSFKYSMSGLTFHLPLWTPAAQPFRQHLFGSRNLMLMSYIYLPKKDNYATSVCSLIFPMWTLFPQVITKRAVRCYIFSSAATLALHWLTTVQHDPPFFPSHACNFPWGTHFCWVTYTCVIIIISMVTEVDMRGLRYLIPSGQGGWCKHFTFLSWLLRSEESAKQLKRELTFLRVTELGFAFAFQRYATLRQFSLQWPAFDTNP